MSVAKEIARMVASVSMGMIMMGVFTLSRSNPERAFLATDALMWVPATACFVGVSLWIMLDADEQGHVDLTELLGGGNRRQDDND